MTALINGIVQLVQHVFTLASPPAGSTAACAALPEDVFEPAQTSYARLLHARCAGHAKPDAIADLALVCDTLPSARLPAKYVDGVQRREALRTLYCTQLATALLLAGLQADALATTPEIRFAALGQALQQRIMHGAAAPTYAKTTRHLLSIVADCAQHHPSPLWRYHAALCYAAVARAAPLAPLPPLDSSCPFVQLALSAN